ncbi:ATP-binding protein [Streptomyces sp. B1866]|uniref:ATP-binding protein n=1 Tax=Streptomyces sp. B1866 TaxID=3075431 RepID=UPI0028928261|nr:ATP-binding protein [Streptomyces sp. B1866]MDT3397619.1 ATP-binding protein [Streptomyces sp. B1866]
MSRPTTERVTTHDFEDGRIQHRRVDLRGCDRPEALARQQVRQALADRASGPRIDDAVLVADELVANAVRHTVGGPGHMVLDVYRDMAVVWVHDGAKDAEAVRPPEQTAVSGDELPENGRGLRLVDVLAARWFVWPTASGKAVAAVIELDGGSERR